MAAARCLMMSRSPLSSHCAADVERNRRGCYNHKRPTRFRSLDSELVPPKSGGSGPSSQAASSGSERGQVAQVVERSPEKAGVGGSTPSLATIIPKHLAAQNQNFQPTIQPMILTELARSAGGFGLP